MLIALHHRTALSAFALITSIAVTTLSALPVEAAPYTPGKDGDIVDQLATPLNSVSVAASARETRRARDVLTKDQRNLDLALHLARLHVRRARTESDPRRLGQAEAVLKPWLKETKPPVQVLILRATIRQSLHQFAAARADLEQVVERDPTNSQAWLTLATVQQVVGDNASARASCAKLALYALAAVHTTCTAAIDGANGSARNAATAIEKSLRTGPNLPTEVRAWMLTLQAELSARAGRADAAEKLFRQALLLDPRDTYTTAALADFLLDQKRPREVLTLIPASTSDTQNDLLLLRRVVALHTLAPISATDDANKLSSRYAAARERSDKLHLREEARFLLHVRNQRKEALSLAMENWQTQKEPADLRILLEAANATRTRAAAQLALAWVDATKLEGEQIARLVTEARQL